MSSNAENRRRAVMAARGEIPFDLLLTGAQIVDMVTGEIREADVGITGEMIASVHPRGSRADAHQRHALDGAYLSPGLMDTHVHLESSHLPPERYAEIVLAQGTTAVFWDPHELANVLGVEGVRYAVAASRHLPLQVMVAALQRALDAGAGNVRRRFCRGGDGDHAGMAGSARRGGSDGHARRA
jgi:adenine deaminase